MSEDKTTLQVPADDEKIWRYMGFSKYVDLLLTQELHFARADTFEDPYDCTALTFMEPSFIDSFLKNPSCKDDFLKANNIGRHFVYLNCWHVSTVESAALWSLYSVNRHETVAVQSTYGRLLKSLDSKEHVDFSLVRYDPENAGKKSVKNPNTKNYGPHEVVIFKRKSFEHEKELRAFICDKIDFEKIKPKNLDEIQEIASRQPKQKRISINIGELIEKVYVSPISQDWFVNLVRNVAVTFGISGDVICKSPLYNVQ